MLAACGDFSADDVKDAHRPLDPRPRRRRRQHGRQRRATTVHVAAAAAPAGAARREPSTRPRCATSRSTSPTTTSTTATPSVDNSVNQQIDTGGGDFDQDIRHPAPTASGDGAVAAGGDIRNSTVTSGDGNQVGDDNIRGDGNVQGDGQRGRQRRPQHHRVRRRRREQRRHRAATSSVGGGGASPRQRRRDIDDPSNSTDISDSDNVDESTNDSPTSTSTTRSTPEHQRDRLDTTTSGHAPSTDSNNVEENHVLSHNDVQDVTPRLTRVTSGSNLP